jgi:hypothetical protein
MSQERLALLDLTVQTEFAIFFYSKVAELLSLSHATGDRLPDIHMLSA